MNISATGTYILSYDKTDIAGNIATTVTRSVTVVDNSTSTVYVTSNKLGTTGMAPRSIVLDSLGNVYTADYNGNSVTKITPSGVSTVFASGITNPYNITIDSVGNLYTSNFFTDNITKITPTGVKTNYASIGNGAYSSIVDSMGNIFVTNFNSNTVTKINPT